jgi:hypothetical protein
MATSVAAAETAYQAALAQLKAAAAEGSLFELQQARTELTAAKKTLNATKGRRKKTKGTVGASSEDRGRLAGGGSSSNASAPLPLPARLPGFGSPGYWAAQPDNPAWEHYPAPQELPMEVAVRGA